MEVVIIASIKTARAGLYVGSFEIYTEDGQLLDSFRKECHRQPMSAVAYNLNGALWDRFKDRAEWTPVDLDADFYVRIPNFIRRRVKAAYDSGRLDHMSEIGKLEADEIDGNLFETSDEYQ
jgi:hypothetical protein